MSTVWLHISPLSTRAVVAIACFIVTGLGAGCGSERSPSQDAQETNQRRVEQPRRTLDARAQALLLQGEKAFQRGLYQRALALADSAERHDPDAAVIPFFRGNINAALRRFDAAQEAFQAVLALDPTYPEAHLRLGDIEAQRGNDRRALRLYNAEKRIAPTATLYEKLGGAYAELGKADSARLAYEQAIEHDSTNASVHMMYGQLLEETGQLEAALVHSRQAASLQPGRPNYQFAVGSQLYQLGRLEEAVEPLRTAADGRLLHYPAQYTLGQVLIRLGREAEAERYLARADSARELMDQITAAQEAASRRPDAVGPWVRLGELYRRAGEERRAAEAFNRAKSMQVQ